MNVQYPTPEPRHSCDGTPQSPRELIVVMRAESGIDARVAKPGEATGVTSLDSVLESMGGSLEPLFDDLDSQPAEAASMEPSDAASESVFFRVNASDDRLDELAEKLEANDMVESAYVKPAAELPSAAAEALVLDVDESLDINNMTPRAEAAPAATPNFINRQGYLNPAPEGVDARYAWRFPGGRGNNVRVIDLEWGWRFTHEDLRIRQGGVIAGTNSTDTDHGTAVIGEISGDMNGLGVTGISPDAHVSAVAFSMPTARAIRTAANNLRSGDIMLLEIHRAGPRHNFQGRADQRGYIAVEWWPDDYAAIRYATNRGIIVVEAAGNGAENLDDSIYDRRPRGFPSSWRNPFNPANQSSRAVVVGAGAPPPGTHGRNHGPDRSRLGFSNYGRRIDAQGWGREVTTTGYGDLQAGSPDREYTDKFSGTSSASPIITAALACVQGALRAESQSLLTPNAAINLLRTTGSQQTDASGRPRTQRIGNRPNLRQMIDRTVRPSTTYTGVWRSGRDAHYLWVNASWSSFVAKWRELAGRNLRLQDFEITRFGNSHRYSGVWRSGSDPHYLWVNVSWSNFVEKWRELAARNLRLIDIEINQVNGELSYSGVWRGGSDAHYLWVNVTWSNFVAKWRDLSARNLRLVDFEIVKVGNQYKYSGVWRHGSDAHYLWVNANWSNFVDKWRELAQRNLRLTKIVRVKVGNEWRFSGIWREGQDSYYLWANVSWPRFHDKWSELNSRGMRLVDFEICRNTGGSPSATEALEETVAMTIDDDTNSDGFGGGDLITADVDVESFAAGLPKAEGGGDGDLGGGFIAAAGVTETTTGDEVASIESEDGFGGGDLHGESTVINQGSEAQLASVEIDDGRGFGGGSGTATAVEDQEADDEHRFGGGQFA